MKHDAMSGALAALPVTRLAITMLDSLTPRTETAFLRAGDGLARAVEALTGMRGVFARLQDALAEGRAAALLAGVGSTREGVAAASVDLDGFLEASVRLRGTVRRVQAQVGELDRVVRTIANVSVNARIQAGALVPQRPQVTAFILRLAEMADEAEAVLAEVRAAMDGIGDDMLAIDDDTKALREAMTRDILPALARCAETGHSVHDRQGSIAAANARIAARMVAIRDEVAQLVLGLQVGDSTRQRLERVRDVLTYAEAWAGAPVEAVLMPLAARLTGALLNEAEDEITRALSGVDRLRGMARLALDDARGAYLAQPVALTEIGEGDGGGDGQAGGALHLRLVRLAERSLLVTGRIETILRQEQRLRGIAHQVRLSGLNAVLICAKLGEDGRALRELAQWLRALTDESDQISLRLQAALDATRDDLVATGRDRLDRIGDGLSVLFADGRRLRDMIAAMGGAEAEAARSCTDLGHVLGQSLGSALDGLQSYRSAMTEAEKAAGLMGLRASVLPRAQLPFSAGSSAQGVLDQIRSRYTMQSERDLHDALVLPAGDGIPAPPVTVAAPPPQEVDDIFF